VKRALKELTAEENRLLKEAGYSDKVIELYKKKVNIGLIENPDVALSERTYTGSVEDAMRIYLRIGENGIIENAKFQYLGCPGAAASGSAITAIAKGKTLEDAKNITEQDLLKELQGLPESKLHCPKLAVTTLQKAIVEYEKKKASPDA
jgi:NifU-like protein involved in Fe-S cluster formation